MVKVASPYRIFILDLFSYCMCYYFTCASSPAISVAPINQSQGKGLDNDGLTNMQGWTLQDRFGRGGQWRTTNGLA